MINFLIFLGNIAEVNIKQIIENFNVKAELQKSLKKQRILTSI